MSDRVLYISPIWTNLAGYELSESHESGMPAFSEPLKQFLLQGVSVSVLWLKSPSSPSLVDSFLATQERILIKDNSKIRLLFSTFRIFIVTIWHIRKVKPDVVFCHGALSAGGALAARLLRKRLVVRVYGTNKYSEELRRSGRFLFFVRYPLVFILFSSSSDALIATDDGSKSDEIFQAIGRSKKFYFLKNGFPSNKEASASKTPILLCVGRIEKKKNQIQALEFFKAIAAKDPKVVLKFIGAVTSKEYFVDLTKSIESSGLAGRIEVLGGMTKSQLYEYYLKADSVVSFQSNSNFGNVAIECLTYGCLYITYNEESFLQLSKVPIALLGESPQELARIYLSLSVEEKRQIREAGQRCITQVLTPWATRASREVEIVLKEGDV
jgi:glycosyltransferase involved in cell wall biosynthesis